MTMTHHHPATMNAAVSHTTNTTTTTTTKHKYAPLPFTVTPRATPHPPPSTTTNKIRKRPHTKPSRTKPTQQPDSKQETTETTPIVPVFFDNLDRAFRNGFLNKKKKGNDLDIDRAQNEDENLMEAEELILTMNNTDVTEQDYDQTAMAIPDSPSLLSSKASNANVDENGDLNENVSEGDDVSLPSDSQCVRALVDLYLGVNGA